MNELENVIPPLNFMNSRCQSLLCYELFHSLAHLQGKWKKGELVEFGKMNVDSCSEVWTTKVSFLMANFYQSYQIIKLSLVYYSNQCGTEVKYWESIFSGERSENHCNDLHACSPEKSRSRQAGLPLRQHHHGGGCTDSRSRDVHSSPSSGMHCIVRIHLRWSFSESSRRQKSPAKMDHDWRPPSASSCRSESSFSGYFSLLLIFFLCSNSAQEFCITC